MAIGLVTGSTRNATTTPKASLTPTANADSRSCPAGHGRHRHRPRPPGGGAGVLVLHHISHGSVAANSSRMSAIVGLSHDHFSRYKSRLARFGSRSSLGFM